MNEKLLKRQERWRSGKGIFCFFVLYLFVFCACFDFFLILFFEVHEVRGGHGREGDLRSSSIGITKCIHWTLYRIVFH